MLEKELRANWDSVFYPEPEPEVETFGEEVEPVGEPVLLAAGPSGTMTDGGAAFGVFPQMKPRRAGASEVGANLPLLAADVAAGGGKGLISGGVGLAGDVLAIGRGLYEIGRRGGDQSAVDAFMSGMEKGFILPTSDDVDKWLTQNIGPVVPPGGPIQGARESAAGAGRLAGELVADPFVAVKGAKAAVKGAKVAGKALAPKAGEMVENYLTKTGAILKVAPDSPGIEVPAAGDITKPSFKRWFGSSQVVDDSGKPIVLYHQTSKAAEASIMSEGFRADKPRARMTDEQVPDGFFFKPTDANIGVGAVDKADTAQIPVYLSLKNPLVVRDRSQITEMIADPEYTRLAAIYDELDKSLADEFNAKWNDKEFMKNSDAWDAFSEQWQARVDAEQPAAAAAARQRLTQVLRERGYDGMIIENDAGAFNRSTKTYIALDPNQVKSVFNKGTWNPNDPRILQGAGGVTATGAATQDKEQK